MPMTIRPSLPATLTLVALTALFAGLGRWQWHRAAEKQAIMAEFTSAPRISTLTRPANGLRFSQVTLTGRFDTERHILVDNRVNQGRPGVHVLSVFETTEAGAVLVNRGWLPMPDRRRLPVVATPAGAVRISGRLDRLAPPGRQLGPPDRLSRDAWPQLVTYPDLDAIASALGSDLYPLVLLLDAHSPAGFAGRDWQPVFMTPQRHRAYALQWFALAATAVVAWLLLGWRRGCPRSEGS
jgi:surfeit locus 1 family protein